MLSSSGSKTTQLALAALAGALVTTVVQKLWKARQDADIHSRSLSNKLHHYDPEAASKGISAKPGPVRRTMLRRGNEVRDTNYVYRVVLTGGPCGGKSSSLDHFTKALTAKGFDLMRVPEVPTILLNGGCNYPGIDGGEALIAFEKALMKAQLQLERSFVSIAESVDRPTVVVMDRGLLDVQAYLPPDLWEETLQAVEMTEEYLASRYDLVLHLVTAADGAEQFYTTHNNKIRSETVEQAKELDGKIRECYKGHSNFKIVDNSTDFQRKLERATAHVLEAIDGLSAK